MVKVKVVCDSVRGLPGMSRVLHAHPVKKTAEDSTDFATGQIGGALEITIDPGTPAADFFHPGKTYTLTFEESTD